MITAISKLIFEESDSIKINAAEPVTAVKTLNAYIYCKKRNKKNKM